MRRPRFAFASAFAFAFAFALAAACCVCACSLIDPLDDISGGAVATDGGSSGSPGDGDGDGNLPGTNEASTPIDGGADALFVCSGQNEKEPNDDDATAGPLLVGTMCGTIDTNDDVFMFATTGTGTVRIALEAAGPLVFDAVIQNLKQTGPAGGRVVGSVVTAQTTRVTVRRGTATAASVRYALTRTGP